MRQLRDKWYILRNRNTTTREKKRIGTHLEHDFLDERLGKFVYIISYIKGTPKPTYSRRYVRSSIV